MSHLLILIMYPKKRVNINDELIMYMYNNNYQFISSNRLFNIFSANRLKCSSYCSGFGIGM